MTKILNFALKIKGGGREDGTCEVLRPCHPPPPKNLERAPVQIGLTALERKNGKIMTYLMDKNFKMGPSGDKNKSKKGT